MMNKIYKILLLCAFALPASCVRNEVASVSLPLEVSAEISGARTRAEDDPHASDYDKKRFVTDDVIKIAKSGTPTTSVLYKRTAAGAWTPDDLATPMTTTGGDTFTATFPSAFAGIKADQSTPTGFWESNRLTATATATGNRVSFRFAPAACKITVIIIYEADNTAQGATVAGKGLCTGDQSQDETITLLNTNSSLRRHTYTGIFSPQAATAYTITVSASGMTGGSESYQEKGGDFTLAAGHEYQYTFTLTNELVLNNVTVKDFTDQPEEDAGNAT
ncbi:fimbrillin family protein [Bacteroides timonensis]|uniref:fimbrillin family protein n=1 Tax=Bacteroides timonensis TaxID=1470345 RepID=UPI0004B17371|nr:fimbrillin family protein [Bacteroides timonensis]